MNALLIKSALEKVHNPNILVKLVSQRVRELNRGRMASSMPLVSEIASLSAADIALREIIEGRIGFDLPDWVELTRPSAKNRRRPQHWSWAGHARSFP